MKRFNFEFPLDVFELNILEIIFSLFEYLFSVSVKHRPLLFRVSYLHSIESLMTVAYIPYSMVDSLSHGMLKVFLNFIKDSEHTCVFY